MESTLFTLIVYSENIAGLLNQVTSVFTRRQINIESLNVSASSIEGIHKYTITARTDEDTIKKVVSQIEKKIDVIQAHYFTDEMIFQHEVALYKLSTPDFQANIRASGVVRRHNARIIEVNPTYCVVELSGSSADVTALYEELQAIGCLLQFVRSGRVAITKSCTERVNEFLSNRENCYRAVEGARQRMIV